jgi:hypothetical protein
VPDVPPFCIVGTAKSVALRVPHVALEYSKTVEIMDPDKNPVAECSAPEADVGED